MLLNKLALLFLAYFAVSGCSKEETSYEDLDGETGSVPGSFDVRLGAAYRDQLDSISDKISTFSGGLVASVVSRFDGDDETTEASLNGFAEGTKLSDLLKIKLPGTDSEEINKGLFNGLADMKGDDDTNYFDVVDTEKYLSGPFRFAEMNLLTADTNSEDQYYLDMIRHDEAIASDGFADLVENAAPIVVAVLDTGVLATHEDLTNVMWSFNGIVGYDSTVSPAKEWSAADASDGNGHGTHVAGIIGAEGDNDKGIRGVGYAPGREGDASQSVTEIMAVKVLNDKGAGTSDMITSGVKWAVDQHREQKEEAGRENQKMIMNMSLGGPFDINGYDIPDEDNDGHPDLVDDVFSYATKNNDVLIIVAAGNESCEIGGSCEIYGDTYSKAYYYPCSYENVLCVAATTHEDKLAGFSNRKASVGLAAPGYQIISTVPETESSYAYYSGTSQATPVTAGAAAMIWGLYPDLTATELKLVLQNSAATVSNITSEIKTSDGRLDLAAALEYAKALKAASKSPSQQSPDSSTVKTEKNTPSKAPSTGAVDPDADSPNKSANQSESTKTVQCAVVGAGAGSFGFLILLMGILIPLATLNRKKAK